MTRFVPVQTLRLIEKSASHGFLHAQADLADRYAKGDGVPENAVEAYMWMDLASSESKELQDLAQKLLAAELATVQQKALDWKPTPQLGHQLEKPDVSA